LRFGIALLCLVLLSLASCASAFPLTGGNGQIEASVLGTMANENGLGLDIIGDIQPGTVTLVDSEDKFYEAKEASAKVSTVMPLLIDVPSRNIYFVTVPANVEIKRIRISPDEGDPFSIEWAGVPEVSDSLVGMKFYGLQTDKISNFLKSRTLDVKVTNNGSQKLSLENTQIAVLDQYGYPYNGEFKWLDLMPGEAARFNIMVNMVSELSRPVYLIYLPSNLTMDISAWA
jgi:hypothetical protein